MKKLIISMIAVFFLSSFCFAETIVLKSGETREGKIIERTDDYIKIDYYGATVTYFYEDIESIDGRAVIPTLDTEKESGDKETSSSVMTAYSRYSNKNYGISITGPKGWSMIVDKELRREKQSSIV